MLYDHQLHADADLTNACASRLTTQTKHAHSQTFNFSLGQRMEQNYIAMRIHIMHK